MRVLALILVVFGGATLLMPPLRDHIPYLNVTDAAWMWISFGALAMAALIYFLAPAP